MNNISIIRFFLWNGHEHSARDLPTEFSYDTIKMNHARKSQLVAREEFVAISGDMVSYETKSFVAGKVASGCSVIGRISDIFNWSLKEVLEKNNIEILLEDGRGSFVIKYQEEELPVNKIFEKIQNCILIQLSKSQSIREIKDIPLQITRKDEGKNYMSSSFEEKHISAFEALKA